MRSLTIDKAGNATSDTGEHIGRVSQHERTWWHFIGHGVEVVANTREQMSFELSTAFAAHVEWELAE